MYNSDGSRNQLDSSGNWITIDFYENKVVKLVDKTYQVTNVKGET